MMYAAFYLFIAICSTILSKIHVYAEFRNICSSTSTDGLCVFVSETAKVFRDADLECRNHGKSLLRIESLTNQKAVIEIIQKNLNSTDDWWFGLYSTYGRYQWTSGESSVPNVYFAPDQKSLLHSCFAINAQNDLYTWKSVPCDARLRFICGPKPTEPTRRTSPLTESDQCPPHFHKVDGACFLIDSLKAPWSEAAALCSKRYPGATLASITSLEQQDYLSVLFSRTSGPAWIGLSWSADEHTWKRGDPISFTNWMPNQPGSGNQSLCTAMLHRPHHLGQWEDRDCTTPLQFICQAPMLPASARNTDSSTVTVLNVGHCPPGFMEFDDRCYQLVQKSASQLRPLPKDVCQMRLAPHTLDELAFMRVVLRRSGHNSSSSSGNNAPSDVRAWVGISFTFNPSAQPKVNFSFEDHIRDVLPMSVYEKLTLIELLESTPSRSIPYKRCAALSASSSSLEWIGCDTELPSICGYNLPGYNLHPTAPLTCPSGWSRLGNKCYSPLHPEPVSWSEAESNCLQLNASLVSLHDQSEHQFLGNYLKFRRVWLGLRVNYNPHDMSTYWSDLSPVDYLSFAAGQPALALANGAVQGCVLLREDTHDWGVVRCDDRHEYVCQINLAHSSNTTGVTSSPPLPKEFCTELDSTQFCLEFHTSPADFVDAEDRCRARSKTLATITSEQQQQFLMDRMRTLPSMQKAYIGLFSTNGTLTWVSSYPSVPAFYWSHGVPTSEEQCVFIRTDVQGLNTWDFGWCKQPLPFICSTPVTVEAPPVPDFNQNVCPDAYEHFGSGCFVVKANKPDLVSWADASTKCAQLQPPGRLASIRSLHEQDGLSVLLDSASSLPVWIGLHLENHTYKWQDNSQVTFTNWAPGNPSGDGERCVLINATSQSVGKWTEVKCDVQAGYICQTDTIHPTSSGRFSKVLRRGHCSPGYYQYRDRCYTVLNQSENAKRSTIDLHDEVSGKCLLAGHMVGRQCAAEPRAWGTAGCPVVAVAHTATDAAFVRLLVNIFGMGARDAWVGLKLNSTGHSHQLMSEDGSVLGASTAVAFESLLGAVNTVTDLNGTLSCLTASTEDTHLRFVPCDRTGLPVVCSYVLEKQTTTAQLMVKCAAGWIQLDNECYLLAPNEARVSWAEAEQACQNATLQIAPTNDGLSYIGHLASIHSVEQQTRLARILPSSSVWLGLRMLAIAPNRSVHFVWSDQSGVDFLNFDLTRLRWTRALPACLTMNQHGTTWRPIECYQPRSYVCQATPVRHTPEPANAPVEVNKASCLTDKFPLSIPSSRSCYHVNPFSGSWNAAEDYCRRLNTNAHLASIHSEIQMQEITRLISKQLSPMAETWFGLHENEFAYAWADRSPVSFVSLSADLTKENRYLFQDCFVLVRDRNPAASPSLLWTAVDCSSRRSGLICELSPPQPPTSASEDRPSYWAPISCPPGYRQYANRCFAVATERMTWNGSNQFCMDAMRDVPGFSGSLATIDSGLVQEFVASLLDDLPAGSSSAWIGLTRAASEISPSYRWADGSEVRYLRSIYRSHSLAMFEEQPSGTSRTSPELCSAIYRSTYPRINGLWLQMACDQSVLLPGLCQAVPSNPTATSNPSLPRADGCPPGFYPGTTGFMLSSMLSRPMCYRLLNPLVKMDWETATTRCRQLSTSDYNVTMLSIASVFEANFLRSWLSMPRSLGGAELPSNEPVWSGLRVTDQCPQCLSNWTWNSTEPVRYTDWLIPPTPSPSGCYVFHSNPYHRNDPMSINGLGSLRPESACTAQHYVACQAVRDERSETILAGRKKQFDGAKTAARFANGARQPVRPTCFRNAEIQMNGVEFRSDIAVTTSNKPCIRWDLVPLNHSYYHLQPDWISHQIRAAADVGSDGTPSYAENFCSSMFNVTSKQSVFGCYISLQPLQFELCDLTPCPKPVITAATTHWITWLFLSFTVIGVLILAVGLWRGCTPLRLGYRRHFTPSNRSLRFAQRGPVHFTSSEGSGPVYSNGEAAALSEPSAVLSPRSEKDRSKLLLTQNDRVHSNGEHENGSVHFSTLPKPSGRPGAVVYHNPIYIDLPEITPEDDYDPEA